MPKPSPTSGICPNPLEKNLARNPFGSSHKNTSRFFPVPRDPSGSQSLEQSHSPENSLLPWITRSHIPTLLYLCKFPLFEVSQSLGFFFPKGWERSWKKSRRKSRNPHSHPAAKGSACADPSVDPELWDHKISRKSGAGISRNFRSRNPPGIPGAEIPQEFQEHSPEIPLRIPSKKSGTVFFPPVPRLILQEKIHGIHTRNDSKTSKTLPAPGKKKLENPLFHPVILSRITGKRRE